MKDEADGQRVDLRERTKRFALRIVRMFGALPKSTEALVLGKQVLRSGTSIGLLEPLEEAMNGKVELTESGRFYLNAGGVSMEMHLVAEGLRKLAMIARLIATGSLIDKGFLFWDEPEANLNPKIIKLIARVILHLCQNGIQMFIASHSLFLMRELDILLQNDSFRSTQARFFGLHSSDEGVQVQQGDSVDDIGTIDALQEELSQSDRYLEAEPN